LDEALGDEVRVTIIATGFEVSNIPGLDNTAGKKTVDEAIKDFYPQDEKTDVETEPEQSSEPESTDGKYKLEIVVGDDPQEPELGGIISDPLPIVAEDGDVLINFDDAPIKSGSEQSGRKTGLAGWMRGRK
jgi:hypothetical protein